MQSQQKIENDLIYSKNHLSIALTLLRKQSYDKLIRFRLRFLLMKGIIILFSI